MAGMPPAFLKNKAAPKAAPKGKAKGKTPAKAPAKKGNGIDKKTMASMKASLKNVN